MRLLKLALLASISLGCAAPGLADTYLVGAVVYASDGSGANAGAYSGMGYQFSTNSGTSHLLLNVNGQNNAISFLLSPGTNTFTFTPQSGAYPVNEIGLELFFNTTGVSYDPAYSAGVGIPGDLAAYVTAGSSVFATPAAGTDVQSYNTTGTSSNAAYYGGQSAVVLGGESISLSSLSATSDPAGSFTLSVAPVPEPEMVIPSAVALLLAGFSRRRRGSRI